MDETVANFEAANPLLDGDPKTLNLPSMADQDCQGECTWTRTVQSISDSSADYSVEVSASPGVTLSVEPSSFTLAPGASVELTVTANVASATAGEWAFGRVNLNTSGSHASGTAIASPVRQDGVRQHC